MKKDRRTGKTFTDYNEYHDRPFGLKWGTVFALDELTKVINSTKKEATKTVAALPVMTRIEIDAVLQDAFIKSKEIVVQRYERDQFGNLLESIEGKFMGKFDEEHLYFGQHSVLWEDIRNIQCKKTSEITF